MQSTCQECEIGLYSVVGAESCDCNLTKCMAAGQGVESCDISGEAQCNTCKAGSIARLGVCLACGAGKYSNGTTCSNCSTGFYSRAGESTCQPCTRCSLGQELMNCGGELGSAGFCRDCPVGFYGGDNVTCNQCDQGTYQSLTGQSSCDECDTEKDFSQTNPERTTCTICPAGTRFLREIFECQICPADQYQPDTGKSSCLYCEDFTTFSQPHGNGTECLPCPNGMEPPSGVERECSLCALGKYKGAGMNFCTQCPMGKFAKEQGSIRCTLCPTGTFSNQTGQSRCLECSSGKFSAEGQDTCEECTQCNAVGGLKIRFPRGCGEIDLITGQIVRGICTPCPLGTFLETLNSAFCTLCPAGKYQTVDDMQQHICTDCPAGTFLDQPGMVNVGNCTECQAGTYQNATGSSECKQCAVGTYQSNVGSDECLPCHVGSESLVTGSSACSPCAAGTFKNTTSTDACVGCEDGQFENQSGKSTCQACADCPDKSYRVDCKAESPGRCTACPLCPNEDETRVGCEGTSQGSCKVCMSCARDQFKATCDGECQECLKNCEIGEYRAFCEGINSGSCVSCSPQDCPSGKHLLQCGVMDHEFNKGQCLGTELHERTKLDADGSRHVVPGFKPVGLDCAGCDPGFYRQDCRTDWKYLEAPYCVECDRGFYKEDDSSNFCTPCGANRTTHQTGLTNNHTCVCEQGFYHPTWGDTSCRHCEPGTWNEHLNASVCSNCTAGTYNENFASHTEEHCIPCEADHYCEEGSASPEPCCVDCDDDQGDLRYSMPGSQSFDACCAAGRGGQYFTNLSEGCDFSVCPGGTEVKSWSSTQAAYNVSFCVSCAVGKAREYVPEADDRKVLSWFPEGNDGLFARNRQVDMGPNDWDVATHGGLTIVAKVYPDEWSDVNWLRGYILHACVTFNCRNEIYLRKNKFQVMSYVAGIGGRTCDLSFTLLQESWNTVTVRFDAAKTQRLEVKINENDWEGYVCDDIQLKDFEFELVQVGGSVNPQWETLQDHGFHGQIEGLWAFAGPLNDGELATVIEKFDTIYDEDSMSTHGCQYCPAGKYANMSGMQDCVSCPAGKYLLQTGGSDPANCTICQAGYYSLAGADTCVACDAGKYSSATGATSEGLCTFCVAGKYSNAPGSAECLDCGVGKYSSHTGATTGKACRSCEAGKYANMSGMQECVSCPAGKYLSQTGGSDPANCTVCQAGNYSMVGADACVACDAGKYNKHTGRSVCETCEVLHGNATISDDHTSCTITACDAGYLLNESYSQCQLCPLHSYRSSSLQLSYDILSTWGSNHVSHSINSNTPSKVRVRINSALRTTLASSGFEFTLLARDPVTEEFVNGASFTVYITKFGYSTVYPTGHRFEIWIYPCDDAVHSQSTYQGCDFQTKLYNDLAAAQNVDSSCFATTGILALEECILNRQDEVVTVPVSSSKLYFNSYESSYPNYDAGFGDFEALIVAELPSSDILSCKLCPVGKSSPPGSDDRSSCSDCAVGKYSNAEGSACVDCEAGKYSNVRGSAECTDCWAGKYSSHTGATTGKACRSCVAGKYSSATGATSEGSCISCAAGKYSDSVGASICTDCAQAYYNWGLGNTGCTWCGWNWDTVSTGSIGSDCCLKSYASDPGNLWSAKTCLVLPESEGDTSTRRCSRCCSGSYTTTPTHSWCTA